MTRRSGLLLESCGRRGATCHLRSAAFDRERTIIRILKCSFDDASRCHRHRGQFARARSRRSRGVKDVAQSARVCLMELVGRGNSETIASRSLFAVGL